MNEGLFANLLFLGVMIGIFYLLLIRPQKKKVERHRQLVDNLELGDEVVTIAGLYGTVDSIGDEDITLEVAEGTTLRFRKSAIASRIGPVEDDEVGDSGAASTEDESA